MGLVLQNGSDAVNMGTSNLCDVVGPVLPVVPVAALLYDLCIDRAFDLPDLKLKIVLTVSLWGGLWLSYSVASPPRLLLCGPGDLLLLGRDLVSDRDDLHLLKHLPVEIQVHLVDHGVEAVVVRAECLQHLPHYRVGLVVVQSVVWFYASRNDHRKNHIATLLVWSVSHHSTDGLNYVHLRVARGQKQHCIERWNVHTFRQTAHVAQYPASIVGYSGLQPGELLFFLACVHCAVYVLGFAFEANGRLGVLLLLIGIDNPLEHGCDVLGTHLVGLRIAPGFNDLAKSDRPLHWTGVADEFL